MEHARRLDLKVGPSTEVVQAPKSAGNRGYGRGGGGHAFADVLSDEERRAIIEYLKTL